ncbi:uncharacterized protein LOC113329543 [Papaver somniferum]|uniref:uncharacterized protein LOC113329543 n=1 Tax=Papaver somniferum TaxID=3469 RepID=UPI000E7041B1|nr:uncharacterized protein LOC113329543 [Papaver somniferum]
MASSSTVHHVPEFEEILKRMNNLLEERHTHSFEDNDNTEDGLSDLNRNILFKFNSGREYNLNILNDVLSKAWRLSSTISITDLGSGYYNAKFQLLFDMEATLQGTPWSVKDDLMLLERCKEDFLLEDYEFRYVHFWIHIYGLPMSLMNPNKVFNIAKEIGTPDPIDSQQAAKWGKFAKVRVRLDIIKPIPKDMIIILKYKEKITVTFRDLVSENGEVKNIP